MVGMAEYRTSAHAVFDIKYHVVWITKYGCKILRGRVAERARDLLRQICQAREVVIGSSRATFDKYLSGQRFGRLYRSYFKFWLNEGLRMHERTCKGDANAGRDLTSRNIAP